MQKYNSRSEVPEEYKWDLTSFFKDDEDFEKSYKKAKNMADDLKKYKDCTKDAKKLYEFLNLQIQTYAIVENLYVYSYLINDQELGVSESIIRKNKAEQLYTAVSTNTSFFAPELLRLAKEEYENLFLQNNSLKEFKFDLDMIYREKEHILSENEEKNISQLVSSMNCYDDVSSNLLNSQHDYGKVKLKDGSVSIIASNNYRSLMRNKDVILRKKIYKSYNKKIDQYSETNASLLNSYISMNDTLAKIHNFKDSWEQRLFNLNLSDKVFKTLVNTTESNLKTLHKYYKLKSDVLGLNYLNMYDLSLEMSASTVEYSIPEAQELIRKALMPLGNKYIEKYDKIIKNRYIDYCQYKGKCSGGYSFSTMTQDSRIMMSFNNNLGSISTIAHESGHNVHHQFVNENNPLQYRSTPGIIAEVMSLTNEILLSHYLVNNSKTKQEKLAGLSNILGVIAANLFSAVREGKMEQDMYKEVSKGGTITKDFIDNLERKTIKKYYGKYVKLDKYTKNSWVSVSHYFMNFYLYNYAICICVATNVASNILDGNKDILDKYYEFMKCGQDILPYEHFKILGIDLEDKTVYENAIKYFDSLIDKYYEIYNQEVGD